MRRTIRNYEKPEGWSKGQPEVLVAKIVVKKLGMPVVNYDALHQFVTDDMGVPYDDRTFIKLYGRSPYTVVAGFHQPYTRTVHVNAVASEKMYDTKGGTMRVVAHELRHRADSTNRKVVTAVEIAARLASYKAGVAIAEYVPLLESAPLLVQGLAGKQAWYAIEPPERRARQAERELESSPHQADILFPNTFRATLMTLAGYIPDENVARLGLSDLREATRDQDVTITIGEQILQKPPSEPTA